MSFPLPVPCQCCVVGLYATDLCRNCPALNSNVFTIITKTNYKKLRELYRQSSRRRSAKLVPTLAGRGVSRGQRNVSPRPFLISVFQTWSRYFFIPVVPQLTSRGWVDPVPDPLLLRKSGSAENRTRDLCTCSQKLWPLDHRGGPIITKSN
jgi:hypothetical protein